MGAEYLAQLRKIADGPTTDFHSFLINQGRGFVTSFRVNDLGNGSSLYFFVNNPDGSEFDYDVVLLPRSTGRADLDISFGATAGDAGVSGDVNNLKSGSSRTFSGSVETSQTGDTGTQPTHGTTFIEDFIPGSGIGATVAAEVVGATAFTIDEGDNKLLEVRNESGGSVSRIGMTVAFFEVDGTFKSIEQDSV